MFAQCIWLISAGSFSVRVFAGGCSGCRESRMTHSTFTRILSPSLISLSLFRVQSLHMNGCSVDVVAQWVLLPSAYECLLSAYECLLSACGCSVCAVSQCVSLLLATSMTDCESRLIQSVSAGSVRLMSALSGIPKAYNYNHTQRPEVNCLRYESM